MGWNNGSSIMGAVIQAVHKEVGPYGQRFRIYKEIIPVFQEYDWDTEIECMGDDNAFDDALKELHPEFFEEEPEEADGVGD